MATPPASARDPAGAGREAPWPGARAGRAAPAADAHPCGERPGAAPAAEPATERILEVRAVSRRYGAFPALERVSLHARPGEFLTLLGPSGSGKTTLLRIIAGLEEPDEAADLRIAGEDVRGLPPNHRNVVTVFQHYALFPHLSAGENVEYGLRLRRVPPARRREKAREMLDLVRLPDKYARRIHQLSGGERQRVALARALVVRPALLLLDEPLGALDEKLRVDMQVELQQLQRSVGTTFVYVTHSQEEALTMSDRIVLLKRGRIEQEGAPREIYERPSSRFVADFMGIENVIAGTFEGCAGGVATLRTGETPVRGLWTGNGALRRGAPAVLAVRAQTLRLAADESALPAGANRVPCRARNTLYKGKYLDFVVDSRIGTLTARLWALEEDLPPPRFVWWRVADGVVAPVG